jgi:hypothetical protein
MEVAPAATTGLLGGLQFALGCGAAGVRLDHQHRRCLAVESQAAHVLDGGDRECVHQLERDRHDAGCGDPGDRLAGGDDGREETEQGQLGRRLGQQSEGRLGDHAERALRADEQAGQVVAGDVLDRLAAGAHDLARGEHDLQPEHPVAGDAVLDAAQPARVLGQVAADGADLERRRVGWIEQPDLCRGAIQVGVDHARLDGRGQVRRVDLEDAVHLCQDDGKRALDRHRATRQPGARTAWHQRHPVGCAERDDLSHLVGRAWKAHRQWHARAHVLRLVESVGLGLVGFAQQPHLGQ